MFDVPVSVSVDVPLLVETDVAYRIKLLSAQLLGSKNTFGATSAPSCYCTVYLANEKARLSKANNLISVDNSSADDSTEDEQ